MNLSVRMLPETLRSLAYTGIGAGYAAIGTPFAHPAVILELQNGTDETLFFSFDGVNDHVVLPASGFILLDVKANAGQAGSLYIAQDTVIWVRYGTTPPTVGNAYVIMFYGANVSV
jgi:hypothetical protein